MVIASSIRDGRKLLIIGLQEENVRRILNDEPIYKNLSTDTIIPGLEDWDITILGPEDTIRFTSRLGIDIT